MSTCVLHILGHVSREVVKEAAWKHQMRVSDGGAQSIYKMWVALQCLEPSRAPRLRPLSLSWCRNHQLERQVSTAIVPKTEEFNDEQHAPLFDMWKNPYGILNPQPHTPHTQMMRTSLRVSSSQPKHLTGEINPGMLHSVPRDPQQKRG